MRGKRLSIGLRAALAIFTVTLLVTSGWAATNWNEKVLHSFNFNGTDGYEPYFGSLIFDAAGNLYGTTYKGGTYGYGTVFELTPTAGGGWTEKVLYSFKGYPTDGAEPWAGLIFDATGNLYGTTYGGGTYDYGTVFELTPAAGGGWTETVLHSFGNGTDGAYPLAGLIFDAAGNLYGTTVHGGTYGYGTVFELTPTAGGGWTETVLHSFNFNGTDGFLPNAGLIFDATGNLYGTTYYGGAGGGCQPDGCGTVVELTPTADGGWTEQVLFSFNFTDGAIPVAGLIFDAAGNLYGTTYGGGDYGNGTVFELTPEVFPTSLDFGPQGLNIPNTPQTIILTNISDQPLSITSIMVTGTNNRDFLENDNCPRSPNTLAPGDHCTITVVFSPTETGILTAAVTITDNALDSPQVVPLTGIGVGGKVRPK